MGISKGAELALAAASYSEEINGVTALSPSSRVNMGIGPGISWVKASSWTFKGDELPYAYAKVPGWRAVLKSIRARELTFRFAYEEAYRNAGDESMIPIEKINGPVLVCGALEDSLWPSAQACDEIIDRLEKHPFKHPHKKLVYRYASHILLPFDTGYNKYFRVGRKYPGECRQTITDLRREIMDWLHM
ncbi:acyl-CoA thioester hydrolase/BAAT C-terminal domain-containing protein [Shuttleworthella sp. MSX8B]|uniref:acyl-CoA thioester hydrolase/BAAT C-terminal domain-containing protein n=1 Tax=Shuttleworthella sp. MSX8B TaxID=936574 RepID=UPI0018DC431C|nr:acyl-CoA thioester hydrolase/BAAT C-terminal domain-containing protein [Shuttleworthia sp. MSX8B]